MTSLYAKNLNTRDGQGGGADIDVIILLPGAQQLSFFLRSFQKTEVGEIKIRSIETSGTDQAWKP